MMSLIEVTVEYEVHNSSILHPQAWFLQMFDSVVGGYPLEMIPSSFYSFMQFWSNYSDT